MIGSRPSSPSEGRESGLLRSRRPFRSPTPCIRSVLRFGKVERGEPRHRGSPISRSNGAPPRWRARVRRQRARPIPATGRGADGAQPIRQRVTAAEGMASGSSPLPRQRRSIRASVPPSSAASWRRRVAAMAARPISPTTAARPPWRSPSSITASTSSSRGIRRRAAGRAAGRRRPGRGRTGRGGRAPTAPFRGPAGGDGGEEQGRGGIVGRAGPLARRLVQCSDRKAAAGEPGIDWRPLRREDISAGPKRRIRAPLPPRARRPGVQLWRGSGALQLTTRAFLLCSHLSAESQVGGGTKGEREPRWRRPDGPQ